MVADGCGGLREHMIMQRAAHTVDRRLCGKIMKLGVGSGISYR